MTWSLANKVAASLLAILICMMAATSFFAYLKLEDIFSSMVRSRYGVVVDAIQRNVEDRLAVGIPMAQQRDVQGLLERYKTDDPQILEIQTFSIQGDVLFDSDRSAIGSRVPESWVKMLAANVKLLSDQDSDGKMVGVPIMGAFGQVVGAVVLRYPTAYLEQRLGPVIHKLMTQVALLIIFGGGVALFGAQILLRPLSNKLKGMTQEVIVLASDVQQSVPPFPDLLDTSFDGSYWGFKWRAHEVKAHLIDAVADVERLDRSA